jgi:hypothetical protein
VPVSAAAVVAGAAATESVLTAAVVWDAAGAAVAVVPADLVSLPQAAAINPAATKQIASDFLRIEFLPWCRRDARWG